MAPRKTVGGDLMSKAQHTPGPWAALRNSAFWEVRYKAENQNEITDCSPSVAFAWGESEEIAEANSRLIAAAPELLEALLDIVRFNTPLPHGLLEQASAAIAKAEGN